VTPFSTQLWKIRLPFSPFLYYQKQPREFAEFKDHFSTRVARYEKVIKLVLSVQDIRGREIKALVWKARNDREQSKLIKRLHFSMRN
jgi:hypothetical protein